MNSTTDILIKDLAKTLTEINTKKVSPYDTTAEVRRIDGNTAWVHIPGGVDETPVQLTTNAKKGDIVQVRISGGQAWLYGNATAPPTDDTKAIQAEKKAYTADEHASDAMISSVLAKEAADSAVEDASRAYAYAELAEGKALEAVGKAAEASESAASASNSANMAYNSASVAINQLGIVEDIVGVLELIRNNGEYERTLDTTAQQDKWYFERSGSGTVADPYEYEVQQNLVFEYMLTSDSDIVQDKPYYTRSGTGTEQDPYVYTKVDNPVVEDIGTYYENTGWNYFELTGVNQTIQNYISDHIAYANGILYLRNRSTSVSLSTDANSGLTFYNNGQQVAQYGSSATIGDPNSYHITLTSSRLSFWYGSELNPDNEVAYIDGDQLFIRKSVVIEQMDVGDDDGMWSWKIHKVNNANNLYLKWIG